MMQLQVMAERLVSRWGGGEPSVVSVRTRRLSRWAGLAIVLGALGVAAVAGAQPASGGAPPPAAGVDAQIGFERHVELSPQQQEIEATALLAQMQATAATTQRMLGQARIARDVVKTLCLNDKLSQVDVANRSANDRKASLHAAVLRNDRELSNHEFTILTVLKKRADQLSAEANQCIGEEASFVGATNVVTTVDTTLPVGDQTDISATAGAMPPSGPPVSASAGPQ
jgi:hypothetical protein